MKIKIPNIFKSILIAFLFVAIGSSGTYLYVTEVRPNSDQILSYQTEKEENKYLVFLNEVYDKVQENYWEKIEDESLTKVFVLGIEKLTGQPQNLKEETKEALFARLKELIEDEIEDEAKKKEFVATLADLVMANLQPFGRSRLYVKKDEIALRDNVQNKTETDYYQNLGVDKEADQKDLDQALAQKKEEAEQSPDDQEKQKALAEAEKAYKVLGDQRDKELYDQSGIAPTMDYQLVTPEIFYIHLTKFSPTTLEELQRVTEKVDSGNQLDTLIFDLRDNVGGAIDGLPYFLGPFIGNDQYAYQFYHQGEETDYKTKIGWMPSLIRYKKVVVLINEGAQSSAEVMASVLKKYNVGVLVGRPTKGWGTVEKVFKLDHQIDEHEEYSLFLVHSVTLREDGQPIEGNGVDPMVNIDESDWKQQLSEYFDPSVADAVEKVWSKK